MASKYHFRTENVQIVTTGGTDFTHGLGTAPAGVYGTVRLTMRTSTGRAYIMTSTSMVVTIGSSLALMAVDIEVEIYHSINR